MEVNIKYKEIDRKTIVAEAMLRVLNECSPWADKKTLFKMQAEAIDKIYKEDSKQIESVEFDKPCSGFGIDVFARHINMCGMPLDKENVGQVIDILTTIKDQMEE